MKKKLLSQRPFEAAFLAILLLLVPLKLSSQNKRTSQPSWSFAFSQDLQEPQLDEERTAEAVQDPNSECWTSDEHVRVVQQSVTAGRLIHKVPPKYPKAARKAHIEGTVILCAEITKDGKIANLRTLSGPKELIEPSIKAVQQWVYKPYLFGGEPVDVATYIRINFRLH